jgi:hypothetical protein
VSGDDAFWSLDCGEFSLKLLFKKMALFMKKDAFFISEKRPIVSVVLTKEKWLK